jgi:spermidine synthase
MDQIFTNRDGLEVPYSKVLADKQTKFQRVRILQTNKLGKIIILDNIMFQAEDGDELTEMATHLPLNMGPKKKSVSMIGAGDGFALKELIKHKYLESIEIVEIDGELLKICQNVFPFDGAWNNPNVKTQVMDGFDYVRTLPNKRDLIISTPANTFTAEGKQNIAFPLFTKEFYQQVFDNLNEDGIFVTDGSTAHYADKEPNWVSIYRDLKSIFPIVIPYFFASKRMPGGSFVLVLASKKYHPINDYRNNAGSITTRYYNQDIHTACFALPEFLKKQIV